MMGSRDARLPTASLAATIAALTAAAASAYFVLVIGQGVAHLLGRISILIPGFIAVLAVACAAGALSRQAIRRSALLGLAAAGLGALGVLWLWIRLFTLETGVLLLIAAGLAAAAVAVAVLRSSQRLPTARSAAVGASIALVMLGVGLGISVTPTCGAAGGSFHIDSWHEPWSAVYACGDGRVSFQFGPR